MRSNILEKYQSSDVRVYVVWFNMLPGDSRDLVDRKVLNDHRVVNYYDPNRVVGTWFAEHTGGGGIVWDAYFLYGADARRECDRVERRPGGGVRETRLSSRRL